MAAALVSAACGDDDHDAATEAGAERPTSTSEVTAPSTTLAPPAPSTAPAGPARSRAAAPARPRAGSQTGPGPENRSPSIRFTVPGRYSYASTGTFTDPLGGTRPRQGQVVLSVDPPQGPDQRSVRQGGDLTTEQVFRLQDDGAYLVSLSQTFMGVRKDFRFEPPALALPAPASVGRSWSWTAVSTDGRTRVDANLRVAGTEAVDVGGERVEAAVVEVALRTSGDVAATSTQQLWVSERHSLVVKQHEVTEGRLLALAFRSESTDKLEALRPA